MKYSEGMRAKSAIVALALFGAIAAPPAARAADPSPAALATAAKILDEVGLKKTVDSVVPSMLAQLAHNVVTTHPEMKAAMTETVATVGAEFNKSEAVVLDDLAHVLAARMSEQELKDTAAFFDSPTGRKYLDSQVPVLEQLDASGEAWRQKLTTEILPRVREEMKKKGFEF